MGATEETAGGGTLSRREVALETALVVWIALFPYLLSSVLVWGHDGPRLARPSPAHFVVSLLQVYAPGVALALYMIRRGDEARARFGLAPGRWPVDALLAAFLFFAHYLWTAAIAWSLHWVAGPRAFAGAADDRMPHAGPLDAALVLAIAIIVGLAEEILYRGYLVTRLERVLGTSARAVAASALLFGLAHVYQGAYGALSALVSGLLYGGVFVACRRLWPLVLAHAAWDAVWMLLR